MDSTYEAASTFAQQWGLVYFFVIFLAVTAYALWPSNGKAFKDAANIPLRED